MPTFVLMTRLRSDQLSHPEERRDAGRAWLKKVHQLCPEVRFTAHYALLGRYDFMDIYEAPDAETAHKVSVLSRAEGALEAESWQALPYEQFLGLLREMEDKTAL